MGKNFNGWQNYLKNESIDFDLWFGKKSERFENYDLFLVEKNIDISYKLWILTEKEFYKILDELKTEGEKYIDYISIESRAIYNLEKEYIKNQKT